MSKYIIVAETGADLPPNLAEKYHVEIVPMHVDFSGVNKPDGSFPVTDVFDHYKKTGVLPRTSGSNIDDFNLFFDQIHAQHPEHHILHLAYSAATTCAYQSALVAAIGRDYVTSVDTKQVSAGQSMVIVLTAEYIQQHPEASLDEIVAQVHRYGELTHMGFFPGDLDYPRAGGRVSNVAYLGAKILSINPLIEIKDGTLVVTKKYRGAMARVSKKLLAEFVQPYELDYRRIMFPFSPGLPDTLRAELTAQAKEQGFQEVIWIPNGGVVATHAGPGAFGVCVVEKQ